MLKKLNDDDFEIVNPNTPTYVQEEAENRDWWIAPEIKNKTAFKYLLAGVSIIGAICLIQSFFN